MRATTALGGSSSGSWRPWRRVGRVVATLAVTGVAALVGIAGAPAASAHDQLVSTDPANGATVATAPDHVTITFTDKTLALGTEVKVTAPDGSAAGAGAVQLSGTSVVQPLVAARPAGTYTVDWRVTSADGHPVSGTFTFVATAATGVPTPTATPTPTASPTATPTVTSAATSAATADPAAPAPSATPGSATSSGLRSFWPFLAVVLLVAAGTSALARRRSRGPGGDPGPGQPRP